MTQSGGHQTMTDEPTQGASPATSTDRPAPSPKPWLIGFLCLLIPMLPSYSVFPGPLKSNGSPAKMLGLLLFFFVVLGFVAGHRRAEATRFRPAAAIFFLFILIYLLVYGVGGSRLSSEGMAAGNTRVMLSVVASSGIALYAVTRSKLEDRHFLLGCIAIGLSFDSVIALLHSQLDIDLRLLLQPPGFVENRTSEIRLAERLGVLRAQGTAAHPIEFSVLAAASVPITLYFSGFARSRSVRILATIFTLVNVLALAASISRTGIIALISALIVFMWAFPLRKLATGLAGGVAVVLVTIAATPKNVQALLDTFINSDSDPSVRSRIDIYPKVSQTFRENPVFGLGLGAADPKDYGFLDNQWLQQIVQGGLFGLLAMTLITAAGIFGISAALRTASDIRQRTQAYAIGAAVIAILSSSFTFDLFAFQQAYFLFFLLIALLWVDFNLELHPWQTRAPHQDLMSHRL